MDGTLCGTAALERRNSGIVHQYHLFWDGYYGLKEASLGYFGKEPQELTDSEAVLLAGIPNAPSAYAPSRHADLALQREKQVLAAMVKYGYLEQSETDSLLWDAAADPVLAR